MTTDIVKKVRDKDGILHIEIDEVRSRDSYSVKATDFTGAAGVQALTIGTGEKVYIERIIFHDVGAAAGTISVYDGAVASAVPLFEYTFEANDEHDFKELGIKVATDTAGIFVKVGTSTSVDLTICVKRLPATKE